MRPSPFDRFNFLSSALSESMYFLVDGDGDSDPFDFDLDFLGDGASVPGGLSAMLASIAVVGTCCNRISRLSVEARGGARLDA